MPAPLIVVAIAIFGGKMLLDFSEAIFPPIREKHVQIANDLWPNKIAGVAELVEMRKRGVITESDYISTCRKNGYDTEVSEQVFKMSEHLLNAQEYITLGRRDELGDDWIRTKLKGLGYKEDEIDNLIRVSEFYPSPIDLVRFAVREVYTGEVIAKFGMSEGLPPEFMAEAAKVGLSEEQAKNYWMAHWELPSAGMGYAMLQRGIIDKETLQLLMKSLDVMPYWQEKLIELSYKPLTRVDVRRMYRTGTLDEAGLKKAYMDTGYNEENAMKLVDFTVKFENQDAVGLTRSSVIKAFKDDLIVVAQLRSFLESFGYSDNVVSFWINMAEFEKVQSDLKDASNELTAQYSLGTLDDTSLVTKLRELDVPDTYVQRVTKSAVSNKSGKIKLPSKGDLYDWLKLEVIDEKEFSDYLRQMGYKEVDIINYMTELRHEGALGKRKYLGIKVYQKWLKTDVMLQSEFEDIASNMGYSETDIINMVSIARSVSDGNN